MCIGTDGLEPERPIKKIMRNSFGHVGSDGGLPDGVSEADIDNAFGREKPDPRIDAEYEDGADEERDDADDGADEERDDADDAAWEAVMRVK